jgi:hypothetical protein
LAAPVPLSTAGGVVTTLTAPAETEAMLDDLNDEPPTRRPS